MNRMKINTAVTILLFTFLIISCKKDKENSPAPVGSLTVRMDNRAGTAPLVFGDEYINFGGDTLKFSTFNYFISNIKLTREDGSIWTQTYDSSYYLIKHNDPSTLSFTLPDIPSGNYTAISFMIGVDSAKSVSGLDKRTGVLNPAGPALGMYWQWNSGYIFVKVEGTSPQAPVDPMTGDHSFMYHIGGYGGFTTPTKNNTKQVTLTFPNSVNAEIGEGKSPEVHIVADVLQLFVDPNILLVGDKPVVMDGKFATYIADNYQDMFHVSEVEN